MFLFPAMSTIITLSGILCTYFLVNGVKVAISPRFGKITTKCSSISLNMGDTAEIATFFVLMFSPGFFHKLTFAIFPRSSLRKSVTAAILAILALFQVPSTIGFSCSSSPWPTLAYLPQSYSRSSSACPTFLGLAIPAFPPHGFPRLPKSRKAVRSGPIRRTL